MKIAINSSSNNTIDKKYIESAKRLLDFLVTQDTELLWGSCSISIMGLCYDVYNAAGLPIYGYTTEKYVDDIKNLPNAKHTIFKTTFDLKKNIFADADMIICLPGGTGTISEFFAYLEELRSNDANKKLVIYDEYHHFDSTLLLINDLIKRNFNSSSIYDYFYVVHNIPEFNEIFKKI